MTDGALEPEILKEHRLLLEFIYQVPVGLAQLDNNGELLLLNAIGVALLLPIEGPSGLNNFFHLIRPRAPDLIEAVESHFTIGEICRDHRISIEYATGILHLSFTIHRLNDDTLMLTFSDVTALVDAERRTRQALEAHAAIVSGRAEMAASLLHDIGNAIVGIGTRSAQLASEPAWLETEYLTRLNVLLARQTDPLASALGTAKSSALISLSAALERKLRSRETSLRGDARCLVDSVSHIEEILSVQRQYAHQGNRVALGLLSLSELVNDALAIYSAALEKQSVQVTCHIPSDLPGLNLDRTRIIQVLGNVIKNAGESFEAINDPAHPRRLDISADKTDEGWVRLILKDTGAGFLPAQNKGLFERGATTKARGSGLGLASCRSTIEAHGGSIELTSEGLGKGAIVTIHFPPAESENLNA